MNTKRDTFQAIAHPTRRAIIMLLTIGAMTPNAIAGHFNSSRQAVSKHLQFLTECEILKQEQRGREIHYHLDPDKMKEIEKWLEEFKQLITNRFNQLDNVLEQLKLNKNEQSNSF